MGRDGECAFECCALSISHVFCCFSHSEAWRPGLVALRRRHHMTVGNDS